MEHLKNKIILVDITSPEVNRGSYCYLSYLLYSALSGTGKEYVRLIEEFKMADMDMYDWNYPDDILVALWSYPQIETALLFNRFLKGRCRFYGYYPLIEKLGLKPAYYTDELIMAGMEKYPRLIAHEFFKYDLLSDCDKHIKGEYDDPSMRMVPMFTSYGCPMGCKFCSATVNCRRKRHVLDIQYVVNNLETLAFAQKYAVHLTDEDFFFDTERAMNILCCAYDISPKFQFIALGGLQSVDKFCDEVNALSENDQGKIWHVLRLIEIGLETADTGLAKAMGKVHKSGVRMPTLVHGKCMCPILWLAVTFFPGETVSSLNTTGEFLREYGLKASKMEERIVTNGTWGGLGQFFQWYDGCGISYEELITRGHVLTDRPMRLIPSFIPFSFMGDTFTLDLDAWKRNTEEVFFWLRVYGIDMPPKMIEIIKSKSTEEHVMCDVIPVYQNMAAAPQELPYVTVAENCTAMAVLARLGIIKGV
jgi:hypothetical protein